VAGIIITDHANAANITVTPSPSRTPTGEHPRQRDAQERLYTIKEVKALMLTEGKRGARSTSCASGESAAASSTGTSTSRGRRRFCECAFTNTAGVDLPAPRCAA